MNMTGTVFNIQRFCIHDGRGIRTTVFLKGCNLRCLWCHNPESQRLAPELMFYKSKCTGCMKCLSVCEHAFSNDMTFCLSCKNFDCINVCKSKAREVCGKVMTVSEVMKTVLKDKAYYKNTGGGLTISGGDPLMQANFTLALLKSAHENGIDTCIETAGCFPYRVLSPMLEYLDRILFDIKAVDDTKHISGTGASNKYIIENISSLKRDFKGEIIFRMPYIPSFNDNELEMAAKLAYPYTLELLPYHNTAEGKYDALKREYLLCDTPIPDRNAIEEIAKSYDNVRVGIL